MASITTWTRLEPRPRTDDMRPSLEARVHDPAWLLGRQWQIGEFVGEDAASPVHMSMKAQVCPLTAYQAGAGPARACVQQPLDALAGPEPAGDPTLGDRAEAGAHLVRLLQQHRCSPAGLARLIAAHPLPAPSPGSTDAQGASYLGLMAGRLPDTAPLAPLLRQALRSGVVSPEIGLPAADHPALLAAAADWLTWTEVLTLTAPADGDAWVRERLEHSFSVGVQQPDAPPLLLEAPAWDGDSLDWYDLDARRSAVPFALPSVSQPLPGVDPTTGTISYAGLVSPLSYPGMPAPRWWQFEDARVNFAQVSAATHDLARMLVVEFACVYSNDWYIQPIILPVGSLCVIKSLAVTNTFGESITIGPVGPSGDDDPRDWCLFRSTFRDGGTTESLEGLLLLATAANQLASEPLEDVLFLRDEMANLAWAVERTVTGADGRPLDRHTAGAAEVVHRPAQDPGAGVPASDTSPLRYQLATEVPAHWFPLAPPRDGAAVFRQLTMRRVGPDGKPYVVQPMGRILKIPGTSASPTIRQDAVPREGARIARAYRLMRGVDGSVLLWSDRRKHTGRGEGSSGLRFDLAEP